MPWRSKAQRRMMYANHPEIAKRWDREYGVPKDLPEHVDDEHHRKARRHALKHHGGRGRAE